MAPAGLKLRELHSGRAAAQPGHRHAHVAVDERRDAREIALDGTTAVVEDAAGNPDGRERLRAGVKRAGPRGTPQVPEGGEAEARPQRQQRGLNRPAAVVASEQHGRSEPDATFFFFFFFFGRKVMPYSRQRKAAKQVMQNLGDGTTPKGVGQERKS